MSYVVVKFPQTREVFMDDVSQGDNRDGTGRDNILLIGEGWHEFRLAGAPDYFPLTNVVLVPTATPGHPFPVVFRKVG